jgi:predicted phosphodiesterase
MRIAVIADVHGDLPALEHVLAAIEQAHVDEIWCLGDIVGLGANAPADVVDLVHTHCTLALAGNHDRWVTGDLPLDMLPLPRQRAELEWQRSQLSAEQLRWLAGLPAHERRDDIELWHGSAEDPVTGWISSPADAAGHLARQLTPIGLVGHTHHPLIARLHEQDLHYNDHPERENLAGPNRTVLNPGAVIATRCWLELDLDSRLGSWHRS